MNFKQTRKDLEKEQGFQAHAACCKSTAVAAYYAKIFNTLTRLADTKHQLKFLTCHRARIKLRIRFKMSGKLLIKNPVMHKANSKASFRYNQP